MMRNQSTGLSEKIRVLIKSVRIFIFKGISFDIEAILVKVAFEMFAPVQVQRKHTYQK